MRDVLESPLLLLVLGAVVTGWLLPRIAQDWQDKRKGLEIKADLVERVGNHSGGSTTWPGGRVKISDLTSR
ncbi:MAG: hypothetical protein LC808_07355 [Actinobacteria bacterium]|nr:hypothetical protein [Actinomycetota bacterium]